MNDLIIEEIFSKFAKASAHLEEGSFREALSIYEELLSKDPSCLTALAGKLFAEDEIDGIKGFKLETLLTKDILDKTQTYMPLAGDNDEFFKRYENCLNIAYAMKSRNEEISSLKIEADRYDVSKNGDEYDRSKNYIKGMTLEEYESKQMFLAILFAVIAVIGLIVGIAVTPFAFIAFGIAGGLAVCKYSRMVMANNMILDIRSVTAKTANNQRKFGDINIKIDELTSTNKKETKAFGIQRERMMAILESYEPNYKVLSGEEKVQVVQQFVVSEDEKETGLFAHTCPNCASLLKPDSESNCLVCPSCGSRFETVYFMGEELTKTINTLLEQKEFFSATEMCDFALSKNSNDIRAKFFKLLAEDRIGGIQDLNAVNFSSREIKTVASKYMIGEAGDRKQLFDEYFKGIKIGQEMRAVVSSIASVDKRIPELNKAILDSKNRLIHVEEQIANITRYQKFDFLMQPRHRQEWLRKVKLAEKKKLESAISSYEFELEIKKDSLKDLNSKKAACSEKIGAAVIRMKEILKIR